VNHTETSVNPAETDANHSHTLADRIAAFFANTPRPGPIEDLAIEAAFDELARAAGLLAVDLAHEDADIAPAADAIRQLIAGAEQVRALRDEHMMLLALQRSLTAPAAALRTFIDDCYPPAPAKEGI
jgi:hypothetical protein